MHHRLVQNGHYEKFVQKRVVINYYWNHQIVVVVLIDIVVVEFDVVVVVGN